MRNGKSTNEGTNPVASSKKRRVVQSDSEDEQSDQEASDQLRMLQLENYRLKMQAKAQSGANGFRRKKKKSKTKGVSAIINVVENATKHHLFKICKFLANDTQLIQATRIVMREIEPYE